MSIKTQIEDQRRIKLAMGITNMGFYDWYPLEDRIIWDKTIHKITGLNPRSKVRRQDYFMSIIHPEDVEKVAKDMAKVLDPSHPEDEFDHHFRTIAKGKIKYFRTSGYRELDRSGQVCKVFGIVMDTSSQVKAEARIRENEERLRVAAKVTGFGTFDWILPENILFWDKRMHEIFGLNENSRKDRNEVFFSRLHPEDKERVSQNYARRMGRGTENTTLDEFRIMVNGEIKYINSYGTIVRDPKGNVIRVTGTMLDITNLKQTEKDLQESQEYFRSVFEGSIDHIFTINRHWEIVFINHVAPGLKKENVVGTPLIDLVVPQDRKRVSNILKRVFRQKVYEEYETSFDAPEGTLYYATRVGPLIENGEVFGATFISRDVTRLKDSERKLRRQAIELQRTNQNLEQFAYVSSHDIKAPVTNLESLLEMIEEHQGLNENGKSIFIRAKKTVAQMNQTIRSLNEVFSVQSNLNLLRKKVNLEKALESVLQTIESQIIESKASINSNFEAVPTVHFPEVHLKSILLNLITNSIKYQRTNTIPRIRIRSSYLKSRNKVKLTFRDNGRGIDLDKYGKKVFGLFQRFHLDTDGKGMGLYIIKLILESYGGEISVKSEPDKGTEFILLI